MAWRVRTCDAMGSSSSVSEHSSLWLERARFTGGSAATSCEDLMRAVLMFIGRWRLRPLAAAACYALRWSSSCVSELLIAQHMKFTTAVTHLFWEVAGAQ